MTSVEDPLTQLSELLGSNYRRRVPCPRCSEEYSDANAKRECVLSLMRGDYAGIIIWHCFRCEGLYGKEESSGVVRDYEIASLNGNEAWGNLVERGKLEAEKQQHREYRASAIVLGEGL